MSELISGKEAWIAKSDHKNVEWKLNGISWSELTDSEFMSWDTSRFLSDTRYQFRLKPRTITLNGIEVPKPQKNMPEKGDDVFTLDFTRYEGYVSWTCQSSINTFSADWWRTELEIKQVVAALRKLFKGES